MAQAQPISINRHPYADGGHKKNADRRQVAGRRIRKAFESRNPATGELLATVAEGDAQDINAAVAAARRAFEGRGARSSPTSARTCCSSSPTSSRRISMN